MGARFALDASSFEKLLAAAWVLQCEQDEKKKITASQLYTTSVLLRSDTVEPVVDSTTRIRQETCSASNEVAPASEPSPSMQVESPVLIPKVENAENAPAEPLPRDVTSECSPGVITALHVMAGAAEDQAMVEISRWVSVFLMAIQARSRWFHTKTIRFIVSKRSMRLARVSIAPILLLSVMFAFSVSQVWKQKAAQASQRTELQNPQPALRDSLQTHEMRFAESLMVHEDEIRNQEITNQHPSSHLHITDSTTASAIEALSPYEMAGLRRQAEYGDQSAALALGMAYETGHSVHQSCTKAAEWIAFAAANDNPAAEYNLGLRYFQGDGLPQDPTEGAKWLARAMAAGYPKILAAEKHSSE